MNNFFKKSLDFVVKMWYIIIVREGISKALPLTDATSTNGEETSERKRRLQVALQFKNMTEEQKREERRKVENRVKRWNESVKKVQDLQKNWKKVNG